jgi:hypothetical protein
MNSNLAVVQNRDVAALSGPVVPVLVQCASSSDSGRENHTDGENDSAGVMGVCRVRRSRDNRVEPCGSTPPP